LAFKKSSYVDEDGVIVEKNEEFYVVNLLAKKNISSSELVSRITLKLMKAFEYNVKIGEYRLPNNVSLVEAIKIFASEIRVIRKITIPEGFSMLQTIDRINKNKYLIGKIEKVPPEGAMMPDTYMFTYPTTKQKIVSMAQNEMQKFLKEKWPHRSKNCITKNPQEALILASIVEKETNVEKERVAGVYTRRLRINMRMQSCPTAIYAITHGLPLRRTLKFSDVRMDLPHNTYVHSGLPPTPICNPGRASIMAALNPEDTDYLFFMMDGVSPYGYYAKTYEEHKKNIEKTRNKARTKAK
jgi:UPF0755 protein